MSKKSRHIIIFLKQLPFLLVFCAFLSHPIAKGFMMMNDEIAYEYVDIDMDDDTEEESEDSIEKDEKLTSNFIEITAVTTDIAWLHSHFYAPHSCTVHTAEIFIPPPEIT